MISVIVPVYNIEKYLEECVTSVLAQSYSEFELILVDDGSKDSSGELCDSLSCQDERIRVIHKRNGGLSSARNAGLDIAKGDYVFFLDGDDRIPTDSLKILHRASTETGADIGIGNYIRFDTREIDAHTNVNWTEPIELSGDDVPDIYLNYGGYFVVAWNKLYKKSVFQKLRYDEGKLHEDEFIAHKIWKKASKICCVPDIVYHYRYTENSIMNAQFTIRRLDSIEAYCNRINFFRKEGKVTASQETEYLLWRDIREKYFKVEKKENADRLKELLVLIRGQGKYIFCNSKFNTNEKIAILIFLINPKLYALKWRK